MAKSIAITGSGIICAIGNDRDMVLKSLRAGTRGIGPVSYLQSSHRDLPVGEVKMTDNEMKRQLGLPEDAVYSRTSLLGAIALGQALADAPLSVKDLEGKRVVFISGTTVGGMDVIERYYSEMTAGDDMAKYVNRHECGYNTDEIARICGLSAKTVTISTACSSALNAIILGSRMLLSRQADIVIAGGTEALSRFHLNGFNSLMILDHEPCRPFDKTRRGLNLGEGAAYVVLEREDDALKALRHPRGYISGFGNRCDAYHQTATSPEGDGAFLAMSDAMTMSGLAPGDIDYINAHGTGTPDNDHSESVAITRLFGDACPRVSSTKAVTGHTTSASGSIETVICLLAIKHNFAPDNIGWTSKDDGCITPCMGEREVELKNVMCNSFGFGGNDSSIIITDKPRTLNFGQCHDAISSTPVHELGDKADLSMVKQYISPMEARRMSTLMKAAILTSMAAMNDVPNRRVDAIIIATRYGMLEQGQKILDHLTTHGEDQVSPTIFMQSTHNTIAGSLAIRLKCHGYNITYANGDNLLDTALQDARDLISEGKANTVLVGCHDYCTETFMNIYDTAGIKFTGRLNSKSLILYKE
ncbi:MAG: beta-ketoacyl synthase chain length factor [Muribaculaceae bacterium]|nr:beta-ketoacyl synthase chain length factor [Muribaculaceae bacterium]